MGVGGTGEFLRPYEESDFFVSKDAGRTWEKARDGPHEYEFGDQGGILVAVKDEERASSLWYSFDYGATWKEVSLGEDVEIRPIFLTTLPDSTGQKFTLLGESKNDQYILFALNFQDSRDRKCKLDKNRDGGDFEKWYARYDRDGIFHHRCI